MGIFDVFTGDPQKEAADKSREYLAQQAAQTAAQIKAAQEKGIGALESGQQSAVGAVGSGIGTARADIMSSMDPATAALYSAAGFGTGALQGGQAGGLAALESGANKASAAYDPLAASAGDFRTARTGASNMSADALGLNGPEGIQRATAAFQAGPGYNFAVNQGLEAILRNNNAAGGGNFNANQLREAQLFGQGTADQEFNRWKTDLANREGLYAPLEASAYGTVAGGRGNAALTEGTGAANIYTGTAGRLADLASGTGRAASDVYTTGGRSLADLASKGGLTAASIYQTGGQNIADLVSGLTKAQVGYTAGQLDDYTRTYRDAAAAEAGGSANLWGLGLAGAQLAAGGGFLPSLGSGGLSGGLQFGQAYGPMAPKK